MSASPTPTDKTSVYNRMEQLGLSLALEPGIWGEGSGARRRARAMASVEEWLRACPTNKRSTGAALRECLKAQGFRLIDGWGEPVFEEE